MKPILHKTLGSLLIFLAIAVNSMAQESSSAAGSQTPSDEKKSVLTYSQLRNFLMNYADQYMQMVGQAADTLQKYNDNPDSRVRTHSLKLYPCSAAFSIASGSNPHVSVLDMVTLVH